MPMGFTWKSNETRQADFAAAKAYFEHPANQGVKKIPKGHFNPKSPSYIKRDDGAILAIGRSDKGGFLGEGGFGRVKYAINADGQLYALKIETTNNLNQQQETLMSQDANLMEGEKTHRASASDKITTGEKFYSSLFYLGDDTLESELSNQTLFESNLQNKLKDARQLCWEVNLLHTGGLTKSGSGISHGDIKPGNVVRNAQGNLKFIDFGLSSLIDAPYTAAIGTFDYMPFDRDKAVFLNTVQTLGRAGVDIFAVKKTLYMNCQYTQKPMLNTCLQGYCIFSDSEFAALPEPLKEMIDTSNVPEAISRAGADTLLNMTLHLIVWEAVNPDLKTYDKMIAILKVLPQKSQLAICTYCSTLSDGVSKDELMKAIKQSSVIPSLETSKYASGEARQDSPTTVVNYHKFGGGG